MLAANHTEVKSNQPAPMTDAQIDAVTAGAAVDPIKGYGLSTAGSVTTPSGG